MQNDIIIVNENNVRIDVYISNMYKDLSRSYIKQLIDNEQIFVNGINVKASRKLKLNDEITIAFPKIKQVSIEAENIDLDIVYQDEDIAVINKKKGMVTHPAVGNYTGTLVNAIMYHIRDLSGINGEMRPGIVHRLDKNTSGLIIIAKNDNAHKKLSEQIEKKIARRKYLALCYGNLKTDCGTVNANIGRHKQDRKKMAVVFSGRNAITNYKVLTRYGEYTLIEAQLQTGRTHQIRVHMKYLGFPIVGDDVYTKRKDKFGLDGQMLHAYNLGFYHPVTNRYMEFFAPIPKYFNDILLDLIEV